MKPYIFMIAAVAALVIAVTACGPRRYCFNEPTVVHGHVVNHIECVSQAYPGRG